MKNDDSASVENHSVVSREEWLSARTAFLAKEKKFTFHTYSTYARGIDMLNVDYHYLDLVPKGREEGGQGPFWVRRHDEYGR